MRIFDVEIGRVTTPHGRLYVVHEDSVIGRSLKLYGEWAEDEIRSYAALLADGDIIIDVGANIGTHSIALATRFPRSEVIAFEPQPLAFSLLAANILVAKKSNVYARNFACGHRLHVLHVAPDYEAMGWNVGAFSLREGDDERSEALPMLVVALDELPFRRRVQFIKIDVEGMESAVLAGASKLIGRDRPIIYFEILEIDRLDDARSLLKNHHYELRWLKSNAFNPRNFRLNPENIWGRGETGILALPTENDPRVADLPLVTGTEIEVPLIQYGSD